MGWTEVLMSGVVSGLVVVWAQHHFVWKTQERFARRKFAYDEAVSALAMFETDVMDLELQHNSQAYDGLKPQTKLRTETHIKTAQARMLVLANFSPEASDAYFQVYAVGLSIRQVPNENF